MSLCPNFLFLERHNHIELGLILMTLSELDHLQRLYLQIRSHSQVQGVRLQQFWGDPIQLITVQELTHTMAIRWWGTTCGTSATRYLMPLLLALVAPEADLLHSHCLMPAPRHWSMGREHLSPSPSPLFPKIHNIWCSPNTGKPSAAGQPKMKTVHYRW